MSQADQSALPVDKVVGSSLEELLAMGDIDPPVTQGTFLGLSHLISQLKARRESAGLSLSAVADRSGLAHSSLIRLEGGWLNNPPLDDLFRYAQALDLNITLALEEIDPPENLEP